MPYVWRVAIASPTRSVVRATTTVGRSGSHGGGRRAASRPGSAAPVVGQQAVRAHPLVVVDLREVAPAAVGQQHDDHRVVPPSVAVRSRTTSRAATIAVPHEPPDRIPSSRVSRRAIANASRSLTRTQRSTAAGSYVPGKKSSPTPSVRYGRAVSPDRTQPSGSAPMTWIAGFCALQVVRRAGDRAAGADARDEMRDPALGLRPTAPGRSSARGPPGSPRSSTGRA